MLSDVIYYRYPEGEKYVRMYFSMMFNRRNRIEEYLDSIANKVGVGLSDELECYFASEFSNDEPEYFGEKGVLINASYPAADSDCAVIMSEEHFFSLIKEYIQKYFNKFKPEQQRYLKEFCDK